MKFFRTGLPIFLLTLLGLGVATTSFADPQVIVNPPDSIRFIDPDSQVMVIGADTVYVSLIAPDSLRHGPLTERDYEEVAAQLGVDVAAMKAVVEIEAGREHKGFWKEGHPLINFDLAVYRKMAKRHGVNLTKYTASHPAIFNRPSIAKYGSQQAAVQARLDQALSIDTVSAIEGTFWGMFQIGGFNWRQCGAESPQDFARLMSRSERDQLELFAEFVSRTGLLPHLKSKNWAAFARGYNGPSYARRRYHTRLAQAYKKYS